MTINFPSNNFYTLQKIGYKTEDKALAFSGALLNALNVNTLTEIKNAFNAGVLIWENGVVFIKISSLDRLLRTGRSGAHNYLWQHGMPGYVSASSSYDIDNALYIAGPDFCGLLDARIQVSLGKTKIYLQYVRAIYQEITSHSTISDLRSNFLLNIDNKRCMLKNERINQYGIRCCEFTQLPFYNESEVEFAHIESVSTAPLLALNINNGVIILRRIHKELTRLKIHDFAGMYDFCASNNYNTTWADNYNL